MIGALCRGAIGPVLRAEIVDRRSRDTRLHEQLLALSLDDLAPPHVDARVAALVALGVVDFAKSDHGRPRFAELEAVDGFDGEILDDLAQLSRALTQVLDVYDSAPRDPRAVSVAEDLDLECRARRGALAALLQESAPDAPGVAAALRRVKLAYGPFDLASDLRALAALVERNHLHPELPKQSRALARGLEDVLTVHDTPELREARLALRRIWTAFDATYSKLAEVGRELFSDDPEALFPTLDAIASIERTARHSSSTTRPASLLVEHAMPESVRAVVSSRLLRSVHRQPVVVAKPLEAEVLLAPNSDSTLWLGFSQDIAEGGVFIATHAPPALGVPVELEIRVGNGEPIRAAGTVHWARPEVGNDDAPPGVGVRFTSLSPEAARELEAFAKHRTPIFYDD